MFICQNSVGVQRSGTPGLEEHKDTELLNETCLHNRFLVFRHFNFNLQNIYY